MLNQNLLLAGDDSYNLSKSLRFRSSASAYLSRTLATTSGNQTFTASFWVKRGKLSNGVGQNLFYAYQDGSNADAIGFTDNDGFQLQFYDGATTTISLVTTQVFRDISAWYHIVIAIDTTQATASNRVKLYVNGIQVTSFSTSTYPSQNTSVTFNKNVFHTLGAGYYGSLSSYCDLYLTEVNWVTGQQLTPSSFGSTNSQTGVWQPKKYTGTYGTNGFYLPFTDVATTSGSNAGLGKDFSGNGNYWNTNNISVTAGDTYDSMKDVPTLTDADTANYCVLNPLWKSSTASTSNGNLSLSQSTALEVNQSTINISSGKWYWETTITSVGASVSPMIGVVNGGGLDAYTSANAYYYFSYDGKKFLGGTATAYGATYTNNDVIGVALDMDSGTLTFYKNGTSQGTAATALSGSFSPAFSNGGGPSPSWGASVNFGQRPFTYTPPTGFKALNTYNLPTPTIGATASTLASKNFDVTTYTGTGATQSIVNSGGFQPSLVWLKTRNVGYGHALFDSVRGVGNGLQSNSTNAEAAWGTSTLASFNSNGFGLGADTSYLIANSSGNTFVAWQWKANGSAVNNTAGSITSQVSANASAGFSIVTYTGNGTAGSTVGHGLGVAPKLIIPKSRTGTAPTNSWHCYHASLGATQGIILNSTAGATTDSGFWNNTAPTSSVITLGTYNSYSGQDYVAYCFSEVAGYSKFGSYTGNGNNDGTFVHLGFRPRFVMVKRTDSTSNWHIIDTARTVNNVGGHFLQPNLSAAEANVAIEDLLSNGFKFRSSDADFNLNGATYIYMAFAETPFKFANGR